MKFNEIMVAAVGLAILIGTTEATSYLMSLETQGMHAFPYVAPWVSVSIALISLIPGAFIGWFSTHRPFIISAIVGFAAGLIDTAIRWDGVLSNHYEKASVIPGPGMDDFFASGVSTAVYLCAFTAFGVVLRTRVSR